MLITVEEDLRRRDFIPGETSKSETLLLTQCPFLPSLSLIKTFIKLHFTPNSEEE